MKQFDGNRHYPIDLELLPKSWARAFVGEVCTEIQSGFASGEHNSSGKGIPHLRPMNVDRLGRIDLDVVKSVAANVDLRRLYRGDVLFNNTNSPVLIGKTAAVSQDGDMAFSNHMTRLRPAPGVEYEFLAHQLHYLWMSGYFQHRSSKHVNQASISTDTLALSVPVVFPPTREQRAIVDALDSYLSRLDDAVANLERGQGKLKAYRASVLNAAVEGGLVSTEAFLARAENRNYEPAETLLTRILKDRRRSWEEAELARLNAMGKAPKDQTWKLKYKEPVAPVTNELPALPEGWCWTSLGQAFTVTVGATPSRSVAEYWGGRIPWVSSGEVSFNRIRNTKESITSAGLDASSTKMNPRGSVLLGMIGEGKTRGQAAILDIDACGNQNAAAIWVSRTEVPPEFVYHYLVGQYEVTRRRGSGNNQPALNKARVEAIPLPLPPLAEQQRIVDRLERDESRIAVAEIAIERERMRIHRLRQAILKCAFEGKLVDPDPTDEPAENLLARIRAARDVATPAMESRRRAARAGT